MRKSRLECVIDLLSALAVRVDAHLARRHLRRGYPQLAIFAFDHIGARVNAFGRYEHDELAALAEFLRERNLLEGACLDIGANIGNHAVFLASLFHEVHAFEPAPDPFALLQQNTRRLGNIHCHPHGLSNRRTRLTLVAPNDNVGAGMICEGENSANARSEEISVVELDHYAPAQSLDIGLMKIDVEGHELQALEGSAATIARCRPVIVFEQQSEEIEAGSSRVVDHLRTLGYKEFFEFRRSPGVRLRTLNILWRLLRGETFGFRLVTAFDKRYYGMLVALP